MWFEVQMIGDSSFMSNHFRGMNGINRIGPPQTIWKLSDHVVKYFLTVKAIFSGGFLDIHVLGFRMIFWKKSFQFWKSSRCPKFDSWEMQTLEIRVEQKIEPYVICRMKDIQLYDDFPKSRQNEASYSKTKENKKSRKDLLIK